jgi:superfamily II DNA or RNA helicase
MGKTVIFSEIPNHLKTKGRQVVVVNREELVWQTVHKAQAANPHAKIGVEKAGLRHDVSDDIIVVSLQTVSSTRTAEDGTPEFNKRLLTINPETVSVVIADEAHRFIAAGPINLCKHFRVYKNEPEYNDPEKLLVGFTATPRRADNKGLDLLFDKIAFNYDLRWGIENKWLCDIEAYRVNTHVDISSVGSLGGDFKPEDLARTINIPERNRLIAEKYIEIAPKKKAIFFCANVQHAHDLALTLNEHGVVSKALSGKTPAAERKEALAAHRRGDIQALTSAMLFVEGYDDPSIEVIGMARDTRSGTVYTQSIGRGVRPNPSPEEEAALIAAGTPPLNKKDKCIVIDFVDVCSKHSLISAPTLFGMSPKMDLNGKKIVETLHDIENQLAKIPANKKALVKLEQIDSLAKLSGLIEKIDLISPPQKATAVKGISDLDWLQEDNRLRLGTLNASYTIQENTLGNFDVRRLSKGTITFEGSYPSLKEAVLQTEKNLSEAEYGFTKATSTWKSKPPTNPQMDLLWALDKKARQMFPKKQDYFGHIMSNYTQGQVSDMIGALKAR